MEYSVIQVALVFVVTFIAAIDQFSFLESLYQPIVTGMVVGLILGDVTTGLIVGGTYQLMTIGNMPIGGAQPPNAVVGGIMAAVLAISLDLDPNAAVAMAIPFSLLGQYGVTLIFTIMSPLMSKADQYAAEANPKGIEHINYLAMVSPRPHLRASSSPCSSSVAPPWARPSSTPSPNGSPLASPPPVA